MATVPKLVAHRGYPARYPENTLTGIAAAVAAGARWLEFDVQVSRDRVAYLAHDASLKRTAGLDRSLLEMGSAELAGVDVGEARRFGDRYRGTHPTRLSELSAWLARQQDVQAFVEIKRQSLRHHGSDTVVRLVMEDLQPTLGRCVVISFDADCLDAARHMGAPAVGWAIEDASPETMERATRLNPDYLFVGDRKFNESRRALRGPWHWVVYEVQDPGYASRLAADGAEFVETDAIAEMLTALGTPPA